MPDRREVEAWVAGVRSELQRVTLAIEPLLAEQNRLRAREALLLKLLQSFDDASPTPETPTTALTVSPSSPPAVEGSVLEYVRACVIDVLREKGGGPMHINAIHARFLAKGFRVPGAGRPANLTAHLGRCEGIVSPARGFYAIGQSEAVQERRKRKRKRR